MRALVILAVLALALPARAQLLDFAPQGLTPADVATQGATTYYVATTGSDSNSCLSVGQECLTIQGAINKIPKRVRHAALISVGPGVFGGFSTEGFSIDQFRDLSTPTYLAIVGSLAAVTPATGPGTGTATAASIGTYTATDWGVLTLAGAGWTVDNLKGKILQITGGGGYSTTTPTNNFKTIRSNTEEAISVEGLLPTGSNATTQFAIMDWATIVEPTLRRPPYGYGGTSSTANFGCIAIDNPGMVGFQSANAFTIANLHLRDTTTAGKSATGMSVVGGSLATRLIKTTDIGWPISMPNTASAPYVTAVNWWIEGGVTWPSIRISHYAGTLSLTAVRYEARGNFIESRPGFSGTFIDVEIPQAGNAITGLEGVVDISYSRFTCPLATACLQLGAFGFGSHAVVRLGDVDVSNSLLGIQAGGVSRVQAMKLSGTGNTTAISASNGSTVYLDSTSTIAGTTEILLDGVSHTLAEMRAATPKYLTDPTTGTRVWGN